ncbi:MAG TPA: fasciclin domain-containing protein [Caulobacteraceae bacterium]|jgi:uncharacterized surface protein with fasciclin (FAS1) repeats|nr:fasciclin domain-containing protein [Caulobacteraceae bacterium]
MSFTRSLTLAAAAALIAGAALAQPASAPAPAAVPAPAAAPSAAAQTYKPIAPAGDLVSTLAASGEFSKFLAAADKAGLTPTLKGPRALTLFVPTDAAVGTSLDSLTPAELQPLLLYHLYGAKITPDQVAGKKGPVQTAANKPIELDGASTPNKINDAVVLQADVVATNGVIYVLDKPLTPPA